MDYAPLFGRRAPDLKTNTMIERTSTFWVLLIIVDIVDFVDACLLAAFVYVRCVDVQSTVAMEAWSRMLVSRQ